MKEIETKETTVLGQKYAYATVSLILGIFCFIHLAGAEKAILAIVFAWMALRGKPAPVLKERRLWAQVGLVLGLLMIVILLVVVITNFNEILQFFENFSKTANAK